MDLLKGTRIYEADELPNLPGQVEYCKDSDVAPYRGTKMTYIQFTWVLNTFLAFQGKEQKAMSNKDIEFISQNMENVQET